MYPAIVALGEADFPGVPPVMGPLMDKMIKARAEVGRNSPEGLAIKTFSNSLIGWCGSAFCPLGGFGRMFFTQVTRIGRQCIRETRDLVANHEVGRVIMTATDSLFVAPVSRHLTGRDLAGKISEIAPSLPTGGRLHLKTEGVYALGSCF